MNQSYQFQLDKAYKSQKRRLAEVQVPIATVSATYRKELSYWYKNPMTTAGDLVYSRAHYSMAEAVRYQAELMDLSTQVADPMNFVDPENWKKVKFTEVIGKVVARKNLIKKLKDKLDKLIRSKSPITEPIARPLKLLFEDVKQPIICLHYEAANLLNLQNQPLVDVVTDPHVRQHYLKALPLKGQPHNSPYYAVFDPQTKVEFLNLAKKLGKSLDPEKVVVTGPPIDPRIIKSQKRTKLELQLPLNLAVTTGGLGQNLDEIKKVLSSLAPLLKPPEKIRLFLYAGTHKDFRNFYEDFCAKNNLRIGNLDESGAQVRILFEDSIVDANNNLIKYMFPWADGVVTKPSGDMAYDAVAAGCFLWLLSPWGEWEENVARFFISAGIAKNLDTNQAKEQFERLYDDEFFSQARKNIEKLPKTFFNGAKNIVKLQQKLSN